MADTQASEQAAQEAAERWLGLIDQGDAAGSLATAAALFQAALTPEQWQQALTAAQRPMGRALQRVPGERKFATELPGAPDGAYVILEFATEFERKKHGVETVVLSHEADGEWRVSGYWIR